LTDCNDTLVKEWMSSVETTSKLDLDSTWLTPMQQDFDAARITDDEMCETTRALVGKYSYTIDPHTAVLAFGALEKLGYSLSEEQQTTPVASILSTASPFKFEESVTVALGKDGWNRYYQEEFPERTRDVIECRFLRICTTAVKPMSML
jgi:threonine synthase